MLKRFCYKWLRRKLIHFIWTIMKDTSYYSLYGNDIVDKYLNELNYFKDIKKINKK